MAATVLAAQPNGRHYASSYRFCGGTMGTYILMSTLTAEGGQTLHANPDRINAVNEEIGEFGCTVLAQYATLGRFDFITIIEAPDPATVAHLAVGLGSRGTVKIETMPAIERSEFLERLRSPRNLGKSDG
jgi:uncharacterized protein with GYD domain